MFNIVGSLVEVIWKLIPEGQEQMMPGREKKQMQRPEWGRTLVE